MSGNPSERPPPGSEPVDFGDIQEHFAEAIPVEARLQQITSRVLEAPGDNRYYPTELTYESGTYNKAAMLKCTAHAPHGSPPPKNNAVTLYINDTQVFRGIVNNSSKTGEGLVEIKAFDGVRGMHRGTFSKTYSDASPTKIARDIFQNANVRFDDVDIARPRPTGVTDPDNRDEGIADIKIDHEFNGQTHATAISALAQKVDAIWWFDENDKAHFMPQFDTTTHEVEGVINHDAAKQTIPYTKVIIRGEPVSDNALPSKRGLPSTEEVRAVAGDGDRVYNQKFNNIHKNETAQAVANKTLRQFQRQRASGKIEIIGDAAIRSGDIIKLPSHYGNEEYIVGAATHNLNDTDGFLTTVKCAGTPGANNG